MPDIQSVQALQFGEEDCLQAGSLRELLQSVVASPFSYLQLGT